MRLRGSVIPSGIRNAIVSSLLAVAVLSGLSAGTALGSPVWQPATTLAPAQLPTDISVALDARGDVLAVWERFDQPFSVDGVVLASYRQAGSDGWQPPVALGPAGPWSPKVAFDGDGNASAVWIARIGDSGQPLLSATRNASTGASSQPVPVAPDEQFAYGQPSLGIDSAGDAMVAWDGGVSAYRPAGGSWQPPTHPLAAQESVAAVAPDGSMLLAGGTLTDRYPFSEDVEAVTGDHSSWTAPVKIGTTSYTGVVTAAIGSGGNAVVSWWTNEHGNDIVYAAARLGGAWQPATPLSFLDGNASDPAVGIDDRGDMLGIWDATVDPEASFRPAGSSAWRRPVAVAPPIQYTRPTLAMNGDGQAVAAWTTYGANAPIATAWFTTAAGWQPPQTIGSQGDHSISSSVPLAIDAAGDAVAVWPHYERTDAGQLLASLQTAILDNGGPLLHAVFNHMRPRISGTARPGRKLRCLAGRWTGKPPITYNFRWLRGTRAVGRAQTYRVTRADTGRLLACRVTATNTFGSVAATSPSKRVKA